MSFFWYVRDPSVLHSDLKIPFIASFDPKNYSLTPKLTQVASSNSSRFEAHAGIFRLLMKGIFDAYVL